MARGVAVLSGGTALGQGVAALASPFLTRIYDASQFGHLAVYSAFLSFLIVVASLRYEMAILLPSDDDAAAGVLRLALGLVCPVTLLTALGVWIVSRTGYAAVKMAGLRPYLWVLPLSLLGAGFYQALLYWSLRKGAYRDVAGTKVTQAVGQTATQLTAGILGLGTLGLLIGDAVGRSAGLWALARRAWKQSKDHFRAVTWTDARQAAVRYRRFPLISSWSALVNTAGLQVPVLLLASHFTPQVVGWYGLVDRIMSVPIGLVGQGASQVYMREAARLASEDLPALRRLFWRYVRRLLLPALAFGAGAAAVGPYVFSFVFGARWFEAGVYARLLAASLTASFTVWPLTATLVILERQDLQLYWDVGRLILIGGALELSFALHAGPRGTVFALGLAMTVAYLVNLWMGHAAIGAAIRRPRTRSAVNGEEGA